MKKKVPDFDNILPQRAGKTYSMILLDKRGKENSEFDFDKLYENFETIFEIRKVEEKSLGLYAFLFTETTEGNDEELEKILHSDLSEYQPSHRDEGYNYAQGWFIFTNGPEGAVTTTTPMGTSPWDSSYLTAYKKYRDYWSLDPSLPKIGLTWGAVKVPVGSSSWPTV